MLPYVLGGLLAVRLQSVIQLASVAALVAICDVLATAGALFPSSSTGAVGLIVEPFIVSAILLFLMTFTRRPDRTH